MSSVSAPPTVSLSPCPEVDIVHLAPLGAWRLVLREARPSRDGAMPPASVVDAATAGIAVDLPATAHDALVAAGLIEDPYRNNGAAESAWIGESDWSYECELDVPDGAEQTDWAAVVQHELVLTRVETVARVVVGDVVVDRLANANRTHRIALGPHLRPGRNTVRVEVDSAARAMDAAEAADPLGPLPYDWEHPYNRVRVTACSAGWDWAPPMITAGIGHAEVASWRGTRLVSHVRTELGEDLRTASLVVDVLLEGEHTGPAEVEVRLRGHDGAPELVWRERVSGRRTFWYVVNLDPADLWWPRGYGAATRHEVTVALVGTDQVQRRGVGFRRAELDASADSFGRACTVVVNGRPVFARGANWIPDDQLVSRVTPERYRERVAQAVEANMTMLRVWGGGRYEDELFYDLCDEAGLLVWQDFAFACAAYPEDGPMFGEVAAEAAEQVRRLAPHPSVVLWCGGNECLLGWEDWGWPARVAGRTWGSGYYSRLLPELVERYAPGTPYVPGSPFSSGPDVSANVDGDGTVHLWDQWNLLDHSTYRRHVPRFAAELGYQSPATWATLAEAIDAWPVAPASTEMAIRQRQPTGMTSLLGRLTGNVPAPGSLADGLDTLDDWLWATQLNQADAMRTAAEHLRGHWPRSAGLLVWQLNDAWPGISWSILDHGGRRKPVWYALREAFAPRTLSIQPRDGVPHVVLVNDTDEPWWADLLLRRVHVRDGDLAQETRPVLVPPREVVWFPVPASVALPRRRREEILVADVAHLRASAPLCRPDGVAWQRVDAAAGIGARVEVVPEPAGEWVVRVSADVVLADVSVLADRVLADAVAADMLRTVLPGETLEIRVVAGAGRGLDDDGESAAAVAHALSGRPVLRTRNDLWHTSRL